MIKLQLKRGGRDYLINRCPYIPEVGEPIFERETGNLKIGDGIHKYKDLPYVGNGLYAADGKSIILDDNVIKLFGFEGATNGKILAKGEDGNVVWVDKEAYDDTEIRALITNLTKRVDNNEQDIDNLRLSLTTVIGWVQEVQREIPEIRQDIAWIKEQIERLGNYENLKNKPTLNGVELIGDVRLTGGHAIVIDGLEINLDENQITKLSEEDIKNICQLDE